jgi:hypothetical protein
MDTKKILRAGLSFAIGMTVFFIGRKLLITGRHPGYSLIKTIVACLIAGSFAGMLYGWLTGFFARPRLVSQTTGVLTGPGEEILFETPANHFKTGEGVGGKLYLTNKQLVFRSHSFNLEKHQLSISLSDIKQLEKYTKLGVVNNGLSVTTSDGRTERFVVKEVQDWVKHLADANGLQVENR